MKVWFLYSIAVCLLFFLASCARWNLPSSQYVPSEKSSNGGDSAQIGAEVTAGVSSANASKEREESNHFYEMVDVISVQTNKESIDPYSPIQEPQPIGFDSLQELNKKTAAEQKELLISVEAMELRHFINLVYGKYLKVNYMVDPNVEKRKDPVTIHMQEKVSPDAFRKLISELLKKYNIVARKRKGVFFIESVKGKSVIQEEYLTIIGRMVPDMVDDDQMLLLLVPFHYVSAMELVKIIRNVHPQDSRDVVAVPGNAIMIKNHAGIVRKMLELAKAFDQPYMQKQQVRLLPLSYIVPEILIERLRELLPPLGVPVFSENDHRGVKLLAMPEISSLLLISPDVKWFNTILKWVEKLDTAAVLGPTPRIFIYKPQYRKAADLAEIILGLTGAGKNQKEKATNKSLQLKEEELADKVGGIDKKPPKATKTGASVLKDAELSITIDESRNTLVIFTTPVAYQEVLKNLRLLDMMAKQVLIEVTLAEVTLTDSLQYGVEWFLTHQGANGTGVLSTLGNLSLGGSGLVSGFVAEAGDFRAMLNAFAEDDLVNILSNPHLVVLDNETASFSVGTDVPVITSESTANDISAGDSPSVLRNIEYRKTGVSLTITPTIFSNGILRLNIDQNVSEAQKNDVSPDTGSPLILDRSLSTSVVLKSGQAILIAGIIANSKSSGNQRVPILGDIPWLGNLFKTTSHQTTKTELLIQVRPIILDTPEEARQETIRFENAMDDLSKLNDFFIDR